MRNFLFLNLLLILVCACTLPEGQVRSPKTQFLTQSPDLVTCHRDSASGDRVVLELVRTESNKFVLINIPYMACNGERFTAEDLTKIKEQFKNKYTTLNGPSDFASVKAAVSDYYDLGSDNQACLETIIDYNTQGMSNLETCLL